MTEIVSWGVLYYAFPVLLPSITADTGWSTTTLTAVFSGALVVSGLAGIAVGRIIDRHGPRWVMTTGSITAVAAIAMIGTAHSLWQYVAGWALAGLAMSAVLYAPAFAAVTVWFGPDRVRALTAITLVAGLASTVFAPLTALLNAHMSWRTSYLVLGAALAIATVIPHAAALRPPWPSERARPKALAPAGDVPSALDARVDRGAFVRLTAAYTAIGLCSTAVVVNLVPLLHSRGYTATSAAWALGIGGVGQVLGRLGYSRLAQRIELLARSVAVFAVVAVTTALFAFVSGPFVVLLMISLIAGNARGLATLLSATAISDRWGVARYARLNGLFTAPTMIAGALAPFVGAGLAASLGGYPTAFVALALLGAAAALALTTS